MKEILFNLLKEILPNSAKAISDVSNLFNGISESTNKSVKEKNPFHLSIKNGIIYLGQERNTMRHPVFDAFDKAVDCDLENSKDDHSRFIVVTDKGEVLLCELRSTGRKTVFRPSSLYGSASKSRFSGTAAFSFQTEKGSYKGYFTSTKIDKLSQ